MITCKRCIVNLKVKGFKETDIGCNIYDEYFSREKKNISFKKFNLKTKFLHNLLNSNL